MAAGALAVTLGTGVTAAEGAVPAEDLEIIDIRAGDVPDAAALALYGASDGDQPTLLLAAVDPTVDDVTDVLWTYDTATSTATRALVAAEGGSTDGTVGDGRISRNGRYVMFATDAALVPEDTNGVADAYVRDLEGGTTVRVSVADDGSQSDVGVESRVTINYSPIGGIDDSGRYAAFSSTDDGLVDGDDTNSADVFVRDLQEGTTTLVSVGGDGGPLPGAAEEPVISADGTYVAYRYLTPQDEADDTPASLVLRTTVAGDPATIVSTSTDPAASFAAPAMSADGQVVAFTGSADDFPGDSTRNVYVKDFGDGTTSLVSQDTDGGELTVNGEGVAVFQTAPSISADGRFVAFGGTSNGFRAPGATASESGVFVRDRANDRTSVVAGTPGSLLSPALGSGADVFFVAESDLHPDDDNGLDDVYRADVRVFDVPEGAAADPAGFSSIPTERVADGLALGEGQRAFIDLAESLPAGILDEASAVAVNVTAAGVSERTFLSVCPGGIGLEECRSTSTVNPYPGQDTANLAFPRVADDGVLQVYNDQGSVLLYLDVVGVFTDDDDFFRSFYNPTGPTRDDEVLRLGAGETQTITLDDVPDDATDVVIRLTASGVTANTYLNACSGLASLEICQETSVLNSDGRDASNLAVVASDDAGANRIQVYNNTGSATAQVDVLGWFSPEAGAEYVAVTPQRIQDGLALGPAGTSVRSYAATLPGNAVGVAANVTAAGVTDVTYVSVCPGDVPAEDCATTSTVNAYPDRDTASSTLVGVDTDERLRYYNNRGEVLLFTDLQGYFVPTAVD